MYTLIIEFTDLFASGTVMPSSLTNATLATNIPMSNLRKIFKVTISNILISIIAIHLPVDAVTLDRHQARHFNLI